MNFAHGATFVSSRAEPRRGKLSRSAGAEQFPGQL
jgi:hypothetical protein